MKPVVLPMTCKATATATSATGTYEDADEERGEPFLSSTAATTRGLEASNRAKSAGVNVGSTMVDTFRPLLSTCTMLPPRVSLES